MGTPRCSPCCARSSCHTPEPRPAADHPAHVAVPSRDETPVGDARPVKIAEYLRVSTHRQDLEVQRGEIRQWATRQGWDVVATYADIASGAREDRPEFRRLLADAARRKFEAVVVQRFDRAARSVRQAAWQQRGSVWECERSRCGQRLNTS